MANDMRLRLVVRRHGLPDTRILFSVPLDGDPTIAQFLELVNATVPLESADWGLDDYAVELRNPSGGAFEALHFQPVASVLQQDEEVYIRPLLTPDLKKRTVSGRHQISHDGKHLIDGVPFGRPLLRQPRDRPAIQIPPRKRRRLLAQDPASPAAEDDWDDEDDDEVQPLRLTQNGEPPLDADEDEQDDSFSADGDEDDMDLDDDDVSEIDDQELTALRLDNDDMYAGQLPAQPSLPSSPLAPSDEQGRPAEAVEHNTDIDSDSDADIIELKSSMAFAFPSASKAALSRAFRKCQARKGTYVARKIFKLLKKRHVPQISYRRVKHNYLARARTAAESPPRSPQDMDMHESDADDESDDASHAGEHTPDGSVSEDGDAQETQSLSGSTAYDSPSGSPGAAGQTAQPGSGADSESESDDAADSEDDESSGDSAHDSDGSEDEADAAAQTRLPASDEAESESESGGDSSGTSDDLGSDDSGGDHEAADQKESSSEIGSDDSSEMSSEASSEASSESSSEDEEESEETSSDGSSGSDSESDSSDDEPPEEVSARPPASTPAIEPQPAAGSAAPEEDKAGQPCGAPAQGTTKTRNRNARRRAKNRLLKNGELEERKKALLAAIGCGPEDPAPLAPVSGPGGSPSMESLSAAPAAPAAQRSGPAASPGGDDADQWSTKIDYHAAECAQEEVALSAPPFPFVQRWDPSQRKQRKRKQRAQPDSYEEGHADGGRPGKKFRFADEAKETVEELNYDDVDVDACDTQADVAHETSLADSQLTDCDDLPSLPLDLTTLPDFHMSDAQRSMVITWKKWLLSEATRWEPQIVDVTAVIGRVNEDNQTLDVMMAKRDRCQFDFAKQFNKETGEREYRAFDPPEFSDDDEPDPKAEKAWNEGWRTVAFVDMIEPRIRQAALPSFNGGPAAQDCQALLHGPTNLRVSEQVDGSVVVPDSQALQNMDDTTTTNEGKSTTSGETDNQASKGVKAPESCVPDTNQDTPTSASASRPHQPAQVLSDGDGDGDALILDDDELMAANASANDAATNTNALISVPVLGQYSLPPCQPVDDSDSPSRQLIGDAVPNPKSEVTSQQVSYPQLHVPSSSVGSVCSGRQPDADDNLGMIPDAFSNAVDTDDGENDDHVATPRASGKLSKHETGQQQPQTPAKSGKDAVGSAPSTSSSSLPSISTLWFTCSTSRNTQSPSRTVRKSTLGAKSAQAAKGDAEYEEAMRRLDDSGDEAVADEDTPRVQQEKAPSFIKQSRSQPMTSIEAYQPSQQVKEENVEPEPTSVAASVSPPSHSARGAIKGTLFSRSATKKAGPSQPAADAEIIILSSSPEPVYEEDYAEDDMDDDYEASAPASRRSNARSSSGYAVASRKTASREPRAGPRGVSVPATAQTKSAVSVLGGLSRGTKKVSSMAPPSSSSS